MPEVTLHRLDSATPAGRQLASAAIPMLKRIVNDGRFIDAVRTTRFSYSARMNEAGVRVPTTSNADIVKIIIGGKEVNSAADGVIDLAVTLYRSSVFFRKTVGYVSIPDPLIHTNTRHFNVWVEKSYSLLLAAHWMHEWMHVAGFYHGDSDGDSNDVAYAVGQHVMDVGLLLVKEQEGFLSGDHLQMRQSYVDAAKNKACATR